MAETNVIFRGNTNTPLSRHVDLFPRSRVVLVVDGSVTIIQTPEFYNTFLCYKRHIITFLGVTPNLHVLGCESLSKNMSLALSLFAAKHRNVKKRGRTSTHVLWGKRYSVQTIEQKISVTELRYRTPFDVRKY